jgi:acyl-CoA synthetase (AMP-forming)/AMP-acid ligase II
MSLLVLGSDPYARLHNLSTSIATLGSQRVVVVGEGHPDEAVWFQDIRSNDTSVLPELRKSDVREVVGIQFTSGTTGLPKGCLLTHEYWVLLGKITAAYMENPQRILADYPFYYMQNQFYLMLALASGGQIFVTPSLSLHRFVSWLRDYQIDFAWVSGSLAQISASELDSQHPLRRAPVDEVSADRKLEIEKRFGICVREWYASTESGLGLVVPWSEEDRTESIGVPLPYRDTRIVDESLTDVASGDIGELCLRGPGMMLGYHNRPQVNAELFFDDGWMRTGDLVRKDSDGYHYFVGRLKDMIRRSGENIAAQEVEQVLMQLPQVSEVAVVGVPDPLRGEEVKAYIVVKEIDGFPNLTPESVLDWCTTRLAAFKVPKFLEFRESLPRTSSGKISKSDLKNDVDQTVRVYDLRRLRAEGAS